ncbi:MAG TPA: hypothetical protein VGB98_23125 [Pyrinomonadaceae bacterium]
MSIRQFTFTAVQGAQPGIESVTRVGPDVLLLLINDERTALGIIELLASELRKGEVSEDNPIKVGFSHGEMEADFEAEPVEEGASSF